MQTPFPALGDAPCAGQLLKMNSLANNEIGLIESKEHQVHTVELKGEATIISDHFKGLSGLFVHGWRTIGSDSN